MTYIPFDLNGLYLVAFCLLETEKATEAIELLDGLIKNRPEHNFLYNKALALLSEDKIQEAE